jgi:hypothetical protein
MLSSLPLASSTDLDRLHETHSQPAHSPVDLTPGAGVPVQRFGQTAPNGCPLQFGHKGLYLAAI